MWTTRQQFGFHPFYEHILDDALSSRQACSSKRKAAAARKELEAERKASGELRRVRDNLLVAAAEDKKSISR